MNRLVIAEKPSVAQSLAAVLGAKKRNDGYLEGGGYLVSWCFGHLAELANADAYSPEYAKWRYEDLPILPEDWQFAIGKDKEKQFALLKSLMQRADVAEVINACDAGREGELIFRTAYALADCHKPIKRLWISSMEDEAIRQGFANLRPGQDYEGLHKSALCRLKADWLVGINATRLFSVLYHRTLNIGRVMSPTLALLVQREAEIDAFRAVPFYTPVLECGTFTATGEKCTDQAAAKQVAADCKGQPATLRAAEKKERQEKPPALYDLTTLQREANRQLNYTAQQTLDYLQALYEKKLCTYPRTDSRYLTADMESSVPALVSVAAKLCGLAAPGSIRAGQVCNSSKVTDHHAIVPTQAAGNTDTQSLPIGEQEILRLIARSLLCATGNPYRYAETTLTLDCGGHSFTAKGKSVLEQGWKAYQREAGEPAKESVLPDGLKEGQTVSPVSPAIKEGKTTPPKHYTEDSLLAAMETAGAKEMPEDAERKGIGTPATRAGILEKLVSTGFVERKKQKKASHLIPTQAGISLITVLPEPLQSPLLTAEWEHKLKEVEGGAVSPEEFLEGICAMLRELVQTYKVIEDAQVLFPSNREPVGKCPRCGNIVTEHKQGFFCENAACRFALWKNNKFFTAKKKNLTKTIAAALLKDGQVKLTGCYSEKTGKTYDALAVLEDTGEKTNFKLVFGNNG